MSRLSLSMKAGAALAALTFGLTLANTAFGQRTLVIPAQPRAAVPAPGVYPGPLHVSPGPYEKTDNVEYYLSLVAQSKARPMPQRIAGTCAKACTIRLGIRGACVEPDAELWFLPALSKAGIIQTERTLAMFSALPGSLGPWAAQATNADTNYDPLRNNVSIFSPAYGYTAYAGKRGPHYAVLSGAQAAAMGAPLCRS